MIRKRRIGMNKLKIPDGSSTSNSVQFYLSDKEKGIEAIRQEDGKIITRESNEATLDLKHYLMLFGIIFTVALLKKIVVWLNLPPFLYHISLAFWIISGIQTIVGIQKQKELFLQVFRTVDGLGRKSVCEQEVYHQ